MNNLHSLLLRLSIPHRLRAQDMHVDGVIDHGMAIPAGMNNLPR